MSAPSWCASMLMASPRTLRVSGGTSLSGEVEVFGSKKSMPKVLIASLLTDEPCRLDGLSWIEDVAVAASMLAAAGKTVERLEPRSLSIHGTSSMPTEPLVAFNPVKEMSRVPILAAGPQLARFGEAWVPRLGGDRIGARGVDLHLSSLRRMGAQVGAHGDWIRATTRGLRGVRLELPFPMVGATEQVLLAAVLARGRTELRNAAVDPEIEELGSVLRAMGAGVEIDAKARAIVIEGVEELAGFQHSIGPDRIEAGSWASLALATDGDILVGGVDDRDMEAFLPAYRAAGGEATALSSGIRFTGSTGKHSTVRIESGPYPLFETDWHPPMLAALTQVAGEFSVHETLFERRFTSVSALASMGADIELRFACDWDLDPCRLGAERKPHLAVGRGASRLRGARMHLPDLRGGFALLVAASAALGESIIAGSEILQRGYEDLPSRLRMLGGAVHVAG